MSQSARGRVTRGRSSLLPESDGHHLHQTASQGSLEIGVRFNTIDWKDPVCLQRCRAEVNWDTAVCGAHAHGLHAGLKGYAHALGCDSIRIQNVRLPFRGSTAMAAHCGHDEGK